jgi:hypothetical protein
MKIEQKTDEQSKQDDWRTPLMLAEGAVFALE